jgi:hypothetical protein
MVFVFDFLLMALLIGAFIAVQRARAQRHGPPARVRSEQAHADRPDPATAKSRPRKRATPAQMAPLAALISFFIPGLGHLFIGAWIRGLIWVGGYILIGELSRGSHTPIIFILGVAAAADAFFTARWMTPATGGNPDRTGGGRAV